MKNDRQNSSLTRRNLFKGAAASAAAAGISAITSEASDAQETPETYDAIVIGTGFGGTIAAIALKESDKKILVIERGTFWLTPETLGLPPEPIPAVNPIAQYARDRQMQVQYWPRPDHLLGLIDLLANRYEKGHPHRRYGLHNYRMFRQAHVLTASGVGGGSLIYSNVNLEAKPAVLDRIGLKLKDIDYERAKKFMTIYRGRMSAVVTKIPLPPGVDAEQLAKLIVKVKDKEIQVDRSYLLLDRSRALRDAVNDVRSQLGVGIAMDNWKPLQLSVNEYIHDEENTIADATHTFCERQGRCMLGCLPAARHTLNKTLFVKVLKGNDQQVTLTPESEVRTIDRVGGSYDVTYFDRRNNSEKKKIARAPQIFLAAGVLGTTEILLRSRRDGGIQFSDKLGFHFSTNGDFGAVANGTKRRIAGGKTAKMSVYPTRGPINTCHVGFSSGGQHFTIEDAGIPSIFAKIVHMGLKDRQALLALKDWTSFVGGDSSSTSTSLYESIRQRLSGGKPQDASKDRHATEAELIDDVFFFNAMGEDNANGQFTLKGDDLDLDWPADDPIGGQKCFTVVEDMIKKLSQAMLGQYTPLPPWEGLGGVFKEKTLIVTHPLGGCRIGPTMGEGVVNEFGQVYDGSKKTSDPLAVHPGLFIVDGSVIPGALAANPTLTISAQAIKTVEKALGRPLDMK